MTVSVAIHYRIIKTPMKFESSDVLPSSPPPSPSLIHDPNVAADVIKLNALCAFEEIECYYKHLSCLSKNSHDEESPESNLESYHTFV